VEQFRVRERSAQSFFLEFRLVWETPLYFSCEAAERISGSLSGDFASSSQASTIFSRREYCACA
jgi:hypothetical protein